MVFSSENCTDLHKPTHTRHNQTGNGANPDLSTINLKEYGSSTLAPNLGILWRCFIPFNIYFKFLFFLKYEYFGKKGNNLKAHSLLLHVNTCVPVDLLWAALAYIISLLSFLFNWPVSLDWKNSAQRKDGRWAGQTCVSAQKPMGLVEGVAVGGLKMQHALDWSFPFTSTLREQTQAEGGSKIPPAFS